MIMKAAVLLLLFLTSLYAELTEVRIAVLAFESKDTAKEKWLPTENYLNHTLSGYHFTLEPMTYPEVNDAVANLSVDFVITNSGHYVQLEATQYINRVATMAKYKNDVLLNSFGGVIFTRSDRTDINNLKDLSGKRVSAVDTESLGGYCAQMYELKEIGIEKNDLKIDFTGMPHANVVQKVLNKEADVGFVRSEVIEHLVAQGKLDVNSIKIINSQSQASYPYFLSTKLYPEWPIASLHDTPIDLVNKVVIALLSYKPESITKDGSVRWIAPMDYWGIHKIFKELQIAPYNKPHNFTFLDVYKKYLTQIVIFGVMLILLVIAMTLEIFGRKKLQRTFKKLADSNENLQYQSLKNETLLRLSGDGVHILDLNANIVQVSDKFCEMLGYTHEEMIGMNVSVWDKGVTDIEVKAFVEDDSIQNKIIQTKHFRKDESTYDVEIVITKIDILNEKYIYCSARDISLQIEFQNELKLAALVYQKSSDAISLTDVNGIIVSVNEAFETLTMYKANEVINKNIKMIQSGMIEKEFYTMMWDSIYHTGKWEGKIIDRKKDGSLFTKWLEIFTVYDEMMRPYRLIAKYSDVTDEKITQQQMWYQANFDLLTDLPNRSMFMFRLERRLSEIVGSDEKVALLYIDLDNFKEINESMGHDRGDILLKEAAKRIKGCVREDDFVFRIGGDEFTVIFHHLDSVDMIERTVESILEELSKRFVVDGTNIFISASIGITVAPEDSQQADVMLKNSEQAMYAAKKAGRNSYRYFAASMQEKIMHKMKLVEELRTAYEQEQFVLYYQPIMELETGLIHKAEALIRWRKENGDLVSPIEFIPMLEETGMIVDLGKWIIREAGQNVKKWREQYSEKFQISINKSPVQFRSAKYGSSLEVDVLTEIGVEAEAIVVEITEGLLMDTTAVVKEKLLEFEEQGIAVSLDDFGTGYSSLSYLKKFHIDYLKIDQSFVRNLAIDENDRVLCEAIIAMSHKLGIKVIAEGVEEIAQRDFLSSIGCDYIQGYLISRPIESGEFEKKFFIK